MNLQHFPAFMRMNFPEVRDEDNASLMNIGVEFKKYLQDKFADKEDVLKEVWDIDPKTVVMNQVNKNPFTVKGYHPVLLIHFNEFIKQIMQEINKGA